MSQKRSESAAIRSLRSVIDEQLAAAAREIFALLRERAEADTERLKELVTQRVEAAVRAIFSAFQRSRAAGASEEPGERRGRRTGGVSAVVSLPAVCWCVCQTGSEPVKP